MPDFFDFSFRFDSRLPAFDDRIPLARMPAEHALRNGIHLGIPRSRYLWFLRGDLCGLPHATLRTQLLSDPS